MGTQSLDIEADTQSPLADLDASPSFCPGCGQSLDITVVVQDGGSGIVAWSLTASGRTVASGGGAIGQTITWDGGGLGGGTHTLELEVRDEAGNTADASFDFGLIAPTPGPQDDSSDKGSSPFGSPTPTVSPTSTRTPRATPTASTVNFGPSTPSEVEGLGAGLPAAPAGDSISDLQSPISNGPSGSSSAVLPPSGVVFGGAALALAGVATAIALETSRRRKEEERQTRLEMERKNAEAEAREAAQQAALAAARSEAEFNLILGQIWDQATGGQRPSKEWLAQKEAMLEPKVAPSTPSLDLTKLEQQDYAAGEAWEQRQRAAAAAAAYATYRASERTSVPIQAPAVERPWWQKAWEDAKATQRKVVDWIDRHQAVVSIAVGVVAAVAVIVLTAGTATPLVVAGLAALAAGGSVALGTVNLNVHYDRPWDENLLRNTVYAVGGATVVTGGWWLATGGLATLALGVGNAVAGVCRAFPTTCARIEPALQLVDTGEQLLLSTQFAIQTATHDPRAGETYIELRLELEDGGVPGNTAIRELSDVGEEALEAFARFGDEGAAMAEVVAERSDEVVEILNDGVVVVRPDKAREFAEDLFSDLRALNRGDIRVYYSATSGAVYASAPTTKALEALEQLEAIVQSGRRSGDDVDRLIEIIASESVRGSGERLVLGKYGGNGLYIHDALDNTGQFYDTGGEVYTRLRTIGLDWDVNAAALRDQVQSGTSIEFSLRGMDPSELDIETRAIGAVVSSNLAQARDILGILPDKPTPARLLEAQWMLEAGYAPELGALSEGVIRWVKQ